MIFLFNTLALFLIIFIVFWFWVKKPRTEKIKNNEATIIVEKGVYSPAQIIAKAGETISLVFIRKDENPCSEFVIFDDLDIHKKLPFNKPMVIKIENPQEGEYPFACHMRMYQGKLIVEN